MNLITDYLEHSFEIKEKTLNTLVLEDKKVFSSFLQAYIEAVERKNDAMLYIKEEKEVQVSKCTDILFDIFHVSANSASILKKLYLELEHEANSPDSSQRKFELEQKLYQFADDLVYNSRFSLTYGGIDYASLFKALNVSFDFDQDSIVENLIEYMQAAREFNKVEVFVIVNMDSFLTQADLIEIKRFLCYTDIRVLVLQNSFSREIIPGEHIRIVDKDLCEI